MRSVNLTKIIFILFSCLVLQKTVASWQEFDPASYQGWWDQDGQQVLAQLIAKGKELSRTLDASQSLTENQKKGLVQDFLEEVEDEIELFNEPLFNELKKIEPCCNIKKNCFWNAMVGGIMICAVHNSPNECDDVKSSLFGDFPPEKGFDKIKDFKKALDACSEPACKIQTIKRLTKYYKIHLMPYDKDMVTVIARLLKLIQENKFLRVGIRTIKIKIIPEPLSQMMNQLEPGGRWLTPKIVIYTSERSSTQTILNAIIEEFKGMQGEGRAPAFNQKVTDLIYFAQGDRSDKLYNPQYFIKDTKIYFDAEFLNTLIAPDAHEFTQKDFVLRVPKYLL